MKTKYFLIAGSTALMLLTTLNVSCSKSKNGPDIKSAENLVESIGTYKNPFEWITAEEVQKLKAGDLRDSLDKFVEFDPVTYVLDDWKAKGEKIGINWEDADVDSVVSTNDAEASEALGCSVSQGTIFLSSEGKKYKINFEQAIKLDPNGPWKTIMLTTFIPLDKDGNAISPVGLQREVSPEDQMPSYGVDEKIKDFKEVVLLNINNQQGSLLLDNIDLYEEEISSIVYDDPVDALDFVKKWQAIFAENKDLITTNLGNDPIVMKKVNSILSADPEEYVITKAKELGTNVDKDELKGLKIESKYRLWK